MRKGLGEKRNYISDEQIADIVHLYDAFEENDRSKIFTNQSFGYIRITTERPLYAVWRPGGFLTLLGDVASEGPEGWMWEQELAIGQAMGTLDDFSTQKEAAAGIKRALPDLTPKQVKALTDLIQLSDGPIVTNTKGDPEPDPGLRDNENIPLPDQTDTFDEDPAERLAGETCRQAINDYVDAEVLPYVPDAWVDHAKTKIGYEIPFNRLFYTYTPPRPLAEIDAEIKALDDEIRTLMGGET
jgi:type I restriction enzyme M protein